MISKTTTPDVMTIQAQSHNPSFEDIGVVRSYARKSEIVSEPILLAASMRSLVAPFAPLGC
jgi:hypothetical protein